MSREIDWMEEIRSRVPAILTANHAEYLTNQPDKAEFIRRATKAVLVIVHAASMFKRQRLAALVHVDAILADFVSMPEIEFGVKYELPYLIPAGHLVPVPEDHAEGATEEEIALAHQMTIQLGEYVDPKTVMDRLFGRTRSAGSKSD